MVLEALRFATKSDSATRPTPLRNGSITSFFTPRPAQLPTRTESLLSSDFRLHSIERLGGGNINNSDKEVATGPVPPRHPSTPPPTLATTTTAANTTRKRKATTPKPDNVVQKRNGRSRNGTPNNVRYTDITSQTSVGKPDTKQDVLTNGTAEVKPSKETRKLRSKEKALFKSDLALYFGNYEEILMGTSTTEPEYLTVDEPIYIVDEAAGKGSAHVSPVKGRTVTMPARTRAPSMPQAMAGASVSTSTHAAPPPAPQLQTQVSIDAKTIHLQSPSQEHSAADPLGDDIYLAHHKRAERREKQLRNIEKERAQHEKAHLERLLDGLQGPDWLRVMGVTGVTEGEQKEWKPKRNYFIKEVSELVNKFQRWKDAERRLRLKKEREREAELASSNEDDEDTESGASSSDLDARAAYQLLQEAGQTPRPPRKKKANHVLYEAPPSPEQPFTGFYKNPHLRAQAMGEVRHGRHVTAFGVELPEVPEEEFRLWEDWTLHDTRRARDRKRRKLKDKEEKREFIV